LDIKNNPRSKKPNINGKDIKAKSNSGYSVKTNGGGRKMLRNKQST
jgi:hypothetical protein